MLLYGLFFLPLAGAISGSVYLWRDTTRRKEDAQRARQSLFYRACRKVGIIDGDALEVPENRLCVGALAAIYCLSRSSLRELGRILDEERISFEMRGRSYPLK